MFHPIVSFENDRPSWLFKNKDLHRFVIDHEKIRIEFPVRLKLHSPSDRLDAVPIDITEVVAPSDKTILYGDLPRAKVVVENKNHDRQVLEVQGIKNY